MIQVLQSRQLNERSRLRVFDVVNSRKPLMRKDMTAKEVTQNNILPTVVSISHGYQEKAQANSGTATCTMNSGNHITRWNDR